jgi:hypothetical protein
MVEEGYRSAFIAATIFAPDSADLERRLPRPGGAADADRL